MSSPPSAETPPSARWRSVLLHPATRQILTGLAAALLNLPLLAYEFGFDQGVFATMADAMLNGQVLYRDAWEHKPPGVFYAFALSFLAFGRDCWAPRLLEIICVGLSAGGVARLSEYRFGSRLGGIMSGLTFGFLYLLMGGNSSQAEAFQIPFVVWGLVLWPQAQADEGVARRCFASGLLLGAALLFKTPIALLAFALLIDRLCLDVKKPDWRGRLRLTGAALAGMAAPMTAVLGYYAARGAFEPFLDAMLFYPAKYAVMGARPPLWTRMSQGAAWLAQVVPVAGLLMMGLGLVRGLLERRGETLRWLVATLAAWGAVAVQGKNFAYYYYALLPFVAIGVGLAFPGRSSTSFNLRPVLLRVTAGFMAVVAISFYLPAVAPTWKSFHGIAALSAVEAELPPSGVNAPLDRDLASGVKALTEEKDLIYVWGSRPLVYFLSDRRPAGGAFHLMQVVPPWEEPHRLDRLIRRLEEERPRLILVCSGSQWWAQSKDAKLILSEHPAFQEFLESNYRLAHQVGAFEYWTMGSVETE